MNVLSGKNILVIGASSGIGAEVVKRLSEAGAKTSTASRSSGADLIWDATNPASDLSSILPEQLDNRKIEDRFIEGMAFDASIDLISKQNSERCSDQHEEGEPDSIVLERFVEKWLI